jgi:hypothetical protein
MALYYPPVKPNAPIYSYQNFAAPNTPISPAQGGSSVTEEWLSTHYLQFPNAQGVENFGFQELNLTNTNIGESATLYLNPSATEDVTLLTNQPNGGLTVRNPSASYTLNPFPIASGIVGCQSLNPIDMNGQGLYGLNNVFADGNDTTSALTLTTTGTTINGTLSTNTIGGISGVNPSLVISPPDGDNTTKIATTAWVLANSDPSPPLTNYAQLTFGTLQTFSGPITFSQSPSVQGLSYINASLNYLVQTRTNYGLTVINQNGNGTLSISNGGSNVSSITCTAGNVLYFNNSTLNGISNLGGEGTNPIISNSILNMNSNSINNVSSINGTSGGTLTLGTQGSTNCRITNGTFTAGNSLGINSTNGNSVFNYYTANNLSLNMNTSETFLIQNAGTSLMELSPSLGVNIYQNIGTNGKDISMLGGDIIGCTSITAQAGAYVTTTVPLSTDSSDKIATTSFVKQFAPTYTQSSFTLIATSPQYFTMSPTPVAVISTYTSGNNIASFNSVPFVITCQIQATFLSFNLQFSTTPFPNYPPPATLYMTVNCSNGATYTCAINFTSPSNQAFCILTNGPSTSAGMTFTCNLATIGAFTP